MNALGERIEPFAALTYELAKIGSLDAVTAPPYDLIDSELQNRLYARSPYNIVRVELNRDAAPYESAANALAAWRSEQILSRAPHPALYHYTQDFASESRRRTRTAIIARVRLEEFSRGLILPHERTFPKAKEDRLRLLAATRTNVSPVFGLYRPADPALQELLARAAARPPMMVATDDLGIRNEIRVIAAAAEIGIVRRALAETRILIADGHHRYETALEYRRRRAAESAGNAPQPFDYLMMALVAFDDPGLVILPTHRVARHLAPEAIASFDARGREHFTITEFTDQARFLETLATGGAGTLGISLADQHKLKLLKLKPTADLATAMPGVAGAVRELDISILHGLILDRIFGFQADEIRAGGNLDYTIDAAAALGRVASSDAAGAFLMNAPSAAEIERVSIAGATMPEKSTYFFPKLLTGLVLNPLDD